MILEMGFELKEEQMGRMLAQCMQRPGIVGPSGILRIPNLHSCNSCPRGADMHDNQALADCAAPGSRSKRCLCCLMKTSTSAFLQVPNASIPVEHFLRGLGVLVQRNFPVRLSYF